MVATGGVQFNPKFSFSNPFTLKKVNEGNNFWEKPSLTAKPLGGSSNVNPFGISIPTNSSYTAAEDGYTRIATGQDGYQARHISPSELKYMQEYKGLGNAFEPYLA
jgi:hypothetical protein